MEIEKKLSKSQRKRLRKKENREISTALVVKKPEGRKRNRKKVTKETVIVNENINRTPFSHGNENLLGKYLYSKALGKTQSGRLWALRALHPNCEELGGTMPIPDHTAFATSNPEFRIITTLDSPGGKVGTKSGQPWERVRGLHTMNYESLTLKPTPIPPYRGRDEPRRQSEKTRHARRGSLSDTDDHSGDEAFVIPAPSSETEWVVDEESAPPKPKPNAYMHTGDLEISIYNVDIFILPFPELPAMYRYAVEERTGSTIVSHFSVWYPLFPPFIDLFETTEITDPNKFGKICDSTRITHKGITVHVDSPSLADQGMIYAAQWSHDVTRDSNMDVLKTEVRGTTPESVIDAITSVTYNEFWSMSLPATAPIAQITQAEKCRQLVLKPQDVQQKVPKTYVNRAKNGCYMPMQFSQPVHLYRDTDARHKIRFRDLNHNYIWLNVMNAGKAGGKGPDQPTLSCTDNSNMGVVMIRSISSAASISIKIKTGYQMVPKANEFAACFVAAPPTYDQKAINEVAELQQSMPLAYPASYNDLGEILKVIGKIITGPVRAVSKVVAGLGIPVVSDIGKVVNDLSGSIANAIG